MYLEKSIFEVSSHLLVLFSYRKLAVLAALVALACAATLAVNLASFAFIAGPNLVAQCLSQARPNSLFASNKSLHPQEVFDFTLVEEATLQEFKKNFMTTKLNSVVELSAKLKNLEGELLVAMKQVVERRVKQIDAAQLHQGHGCLYVWSFPLVNEPEVRVTSSLSESVSTQLSQLDELGFRVLSVYLNRTQFESSSLSWMLNHKALLLEMVARAFQRLSPERQSVVLRSGEGVELVRLKRMGRLQTVARSLVCIFVVSSVTSLYNYMSAYLVPIIYLYLHRVGLVQIDATTIYSTLPWIGLYEYPFVLTRRNGGFLQAVLKMFGLLLFVYLSMVYLVRSWLVSEYTSYSTAQDLVNLVTFLEIQAALFYRTRSSIKYLPRICLLTLLLLCYCQERVVLTFRTSPLNLAYCFLQLVLIGFIFYFEKPAVSEWNPREAYTPTDQRMRCLHSTTFSTAWINDLAPFWTVFMPLFGRSTFEPQDFEFNQPHPELVPVPEPNEQDPPLEQ